MKRRHWTAVEIDTVRRLYPHTTCVDVASVLGRTPRSVYECAHLHGVKKSAAFLASGQSGRLDGVRGGRTRFKAGLIPWNKGLKGWTAGGRSAETRFKKGNISARWDQEIYAVGALRINTDGGIEIKVAPGPRQWVPLARYTWQTERGPIPPGHVVRVKNDDAYDAADIDNLELLSREENMRRNSVHRLPKALAQLVQLRGALNRKINRRTKDERNDHGSARVPIRSLARVNR